MTTPKQPTEAEINEAAVNTCPDTLANWSQETMFEVGFADGVKWLQNYQAQQPVKQVRSAEEILMPYVQRPDEAPDYVFLFHALQAMREYASQFQTPAIGFDASLIEEMSPGDAYAEPAKGSNEGKMVESPNVQEGKIHPNIGIVQRLSSAYNNINDVEHFLEVVTEIAKDADNILSNEGN